MVDGQDAPHVVVLAGPNGAGKSTAASVLLPRLLGVGPFVNADVIAQGLSAFAPEKVAVTAGKIMLERLRELAAERANFAFETTLATRSFARWLRRLVADGYRFELAFFYLPSPELAIARVAQRVRQGGHHVPDDDVRRRYRRGLRNLMHLYIPLATHWRVYDNGVPGVSRLIASGTRWEQVAVFDNPLWTSLRMEYRDAHDEEAND
ncbi:MAG TPA: zeta toxin family protein [Humisphaera sp.]